MTLSKHLSEVDTWSGRPRPVGQLCLYISQREKHFSFPSARSVSRPTKQQQQQQLTVADKLRVISVFVSVHDEVLLHGVVLAARLPHLPRDPGAVLLGQVLGSQVARVRN